MLYSFCFSQQSDSYASDPLNRFLCSPFAVFKHRTVMSVGGKKASIGDGAFVAPSAAVIGDVTLGKRASIWYGTVLRGELMSFMPMPAALCHAKCTWHLSATRLSIHICPLLMAIVTQVTRLRSQ